MIRERIIKTLLILKKFDMLKLKKLKPIPSKYICQYCEQTKPLNQDFFQSVRGFKHGYSTYCNECDVNTRKLKPKND